jgi:hypothetical protein
VSLPTQLERVLRAAKSYRGVCQADFLGDTVDGGPNITRVAARLQEAEDRGHEFELLGRRDKCRIYRWISGPEGSGDEGRAADLNGTGPAPAEASQAGVTVPLSAEPTLFDTPTQAKPHWRQEAA